MALPLNDKVFFSEGFHRYIDDDFKSYSGITAIIHKCICPDLYGDVDEATLARAAKHGTLCHKLCEAFDNASLNLNDDGTYSALSPVTAYNGAELEELVAEGECIHDKELYAYVSLIRAHNLYIEASEYLISDDHFASCIDKVIKEKEDDTYSILDLKFTYQYHEEPVTWQTSFYADMFERQTGFKVKNLYCIHIHAYKDGTMKQDLHKLKRIKSDILDECKRCFLLDIPFDNPLRKKKCELADFTLDIDGKTWNAAEMYEAMKVAKQYAAIDKKIKDGLKGWFTEHPDYNKLVLPHISCSQTSSTNAFCFDEERLKAEHPDLYASYCTGHRTIAGRTTITLTK